MNDDTDISACTGLTEHDDGPETEQRHNAEHLLADSSTLHGGTLTSLSDSVNKAGSVGEVTPSKNSVRSSIPSATTTPTKSQFTPNSGSYNALKSFGDQVYSGMAIGGSHTWNYDPGVWKETKEEPDLWKIDFETTKRRAKNAPKGSGAPVGTEYHWLIVSHQYVKKVDANTYTTHLTGSKYKLAHKNADSNSWSVNTVKGQRDRELKLLDDAKRRVEGLPPVTAGEKVKSENREKGQQKLENLFAKAGNAKQSNTKDTSKPLKRKSLDGDQDTENIEPASKVVRT